MSFLKIVQLSDPHFGTILPGVQEGLIRTLQELKPDLILLTGDITQRARRSQFSAAKNFTHLLNPIPLIAIPGNHDIPLFNVFARLFYPYYGFQKLFKDRLEKGYRKGDILVSGFNSTSRWRHIQGKLEKNKIEYFLKKKEPTAKVHIVAFHHPMDCSKEIDEKNLLVNREEMLPVFANSGADVLLGGHIHDPFVTLSTKRYPHEKRSMVIAVAGTCLSWRTRKGAPNSFNLMEIDTSSSPLLTVTRYDQNKSLEFAPVSSAAFSRDPAGNWELCSPR